MFSIGRVTPSDLLRIAGDGQSTEPTYSEIGATLTGHLPGGYRHDRYEASLGAPESGAFDRGAGGLRQWAAHRGAGFVVEPHQPPVEGATVAVATSVGPFSVVAVCRIVAVVDEPDRYGFAYGTLPGHPERGEEAFLVERDGSRVVFRIAAFSRPAELLARLGGPVTRSIQQRASRRYLLALQEFAAGST